MTLHIRNFYRNILSPDKPGLLENKIPKGAGGMSDLYKRPEKFLQKFLHEATNPSLLAAMALGGLAFRSARFAFLTLAERWGGTFFSTGLTGRIFSAAAGTVAEAPIFNGTSRAVGSLFSPGQPVNPGDPLRETAATAGMFASLRTFGFAGALALSLTRSWGMGGAAKAITGMVLPAIFQIGGLHFNHLMQQRLGWLDPHRGDSTLAGHLATLIQFSGIGVVLRGALGERWAALENSMDQQMEWQLALPHFKWELGLEGAYQGGTHGPARPLKGKGDPLVSNHWAMTDTFSSELPSISRDSDFFDGPAVNTPKKIFPWTRQRELEIPEGRLYVEHGSRNDLKQDSEILGRMRHLEKFLKEPFYKFYGTTFEKFHGLLSKVLVDFPGIFWGIKRELSQPGFKVWVQMDADQESLWNMMLLDGFDRPRRCLLTLPDGQEILENKIDYQSSGLPKINGAYLTIDPRKRDKVTTHPIHRVNYDGHWEENLDHPGVQLQLFQKKSFNISFVHQREIPVSIQYSMGDRMASWEWQVLPFFGTMLSLETRYEEFRYPTVKSLKEAGVRPAPNTPQKPKSAKLSDKPPEPRIDPTPPLPRHIRELNNLVTTKIKKLQYGSKLNSRDYHRLLRKLYLGLQGNEDLKHAHPLILEGIPNFLEIPYHGPSFITHYGNMVSEEGRIDVLKKVLPHLKSPHPPRAASAFEVVRILSPFLSQTHRKYILGEMQKTYGNLKEWNQVTTMVYQARRALESPSSYKKLFAPTFLK